MPVQSYNSTPLPAMTAAPSVNATARVLIVDDDATSRRLLSAALMRAEFDVITASDGNEALERIHENPPDIAVLDFEMPALNGAELCAKIRQDESPPIRDLPVLMLTAHSGEEDEVACLQAGANDFVTKPVSRAVLVARIQTQLRLRALGDTLREQHDELARWRATQLGELDAARVTQSAIIPQVPPQVPGWHVQTMYTPLIQVGGDVYGWRRRPDGDWLFWVADATGHGVAAALFTALTALLFQQAAADSSSPGQVLSQVNDEFCNVFRGKSFMTGCCVRISASGELAFAGAGHPPLLIRRADGTVEELRAQSTVLGLKKSERTEESTTRLEVNEMALLYTDGLYSLIGKDGERMRSQVLSKCLGSPRVGPAELDQITRMVVKHSDRTPSDDDAAAIRLLRT
jgi:sigma-B regulation protein RsbU (phosphoserine phosphatase)